MIDLQLVESQLREAVEERYHGKSVGIEVRRNPRGIHVTIWPTRGGQLFTHWVNVKPDGAVELPAPDDGFTSINAKPLHVTTTSTDSTAFREALSLIDGAVAQIQQRIDDTRASLLAPYRLEQVDADLLAAACLRWQGGRDGGSTLLRAGARVLLDVRHYFNADYITSKESEAASNWKVLTESSGLLRAMNAAPALTADQWCERVGLPHSGFAGRGLQPKPDEDEQILAKLKRGSIRMPLWGVSLDPEIAQSFGGAAPRWIFEIVGEFRAVPAWLHSGIKSAERELICGGDFNVLSMVDEGPTTRVRLEYARRVGQQVGSNPVLLELISLLEDRSRCRLEHSGGPHRTNHIETLEVSLTGNRALQFEFYSERPDEIRTSYRPYGWHDEDPNPMYPSWFPEWRFESGDGFTKVKLPADACLIAAHIARRADPAWLEVQNGLSRALYSCYYSDDESAADSGGSFDLPGGGYVQWTRLDIPGSDLHIEINEGRFDVPMPIDLVYRFGMIGWRPPDREFRNCWLRIGPPWETTFGMEERDFRWAAQRIIIATTVVLGVPLIELPR